MDRKNRVYWLTGLSGAGKTTIGRLWYEELKKSGEKVVLLDGDELRAVFGGGFGFTAEARLKLGMSYGRLCALLAAQGFLPCSTACVHGIGPTSPAIMRCTYRPQWTRCASGTRKGSTAGTQRT